MWELTIPRTIVTGEGALEYLKEVEGKRVLIVTDKVIHKLDFAEKVANYLKEAGLEVKIFDEVEPEPSIETVMKGAEFARKYGPDWFIGLGGGSCMDAAKAIWALYERPDISVNGINPLEKLGLRKKARLICIPTTSGTGSDATWATIITDVKDERKLELPSREIAPDIAILDPDLPKSMPPSLVADTGLDALTHAIEAYVSQWRNDFSDALAIKAIQMVFKYLPRAYKNPEDKEAKEKMHNAATMAGIAFSNSQVGIAHAMGHSLGAIFQVPHGRTVDLFLSYSIEYGAREALARVAPEFLVKFFDKKYEKLSFGELCEAPVSAISGVSESDAADLKKAFGITTVKELATNQYVLMAQGINSFSKYSGKILDKEFESAEFEELRKKPVSAISGISDGDAVLLKKAFGIDTIQELAENKYVRIAQLVTPLVSLAKLLGARAMERYADIARAIGIEAETDEEAVEKLVEAVRRLGREVGEPAAIKELGISRENFEKRLDDLVTRAANSSCTFMNPRVPDVEDARKLFLYAFEGKRVDF